MATGAITPAWLQRRPTHIFQSLEEEKKRAAQVNSAVWNTHTHTQMSAHVKEPALRERVFHLQRVFAPPAGFPFDCCSCGEMLRVDGEQKHKGFQIGTEQRWSCLFTYRGDRTYVWPPQ